MTNDHDAFEAFKKMVLDTEKEEGVEDAPLNDAEALKDELLRQNSERSFGPDDPRTDDEIWAEAMKNGDFRSALKREGTDGS